MQSLKKIHAWAQMQDPLSNTFLFLFSIKMLVFRGAKIHNMVVKIANREHPDQTASSEAV